MARSAATISSLRATIRSSGLGICIAVSSTALRSRCVRRIVSDDDCRTAAAAAPNEEPRQTARFQGGVCAAPRRRRASALARLEARALLVDDVDPALAADHLAFLMPFLDRFQRVDDFHELG